MRVGVVIPTYDQYGDAAVIRRLIGEAEALGYHSVWFGDHIVVPEYAIRRTDPHWFEAMTCAIAGIGMTSRLSFGTDVLVTPYRNPLLLAKMAATASELSAGRLLLGMGVGFLKGEFEALDAPPFSRRGAATDEYLRVMRLLFEADGDRPLSFDGEWIKFEDIRFGPRPAKAPPLLVGGNHRRAHERAARLGDGWHPLWATPEAYAEGRRRISQLRAAEDVTRPFTFSFSCSYTRLLAVGEAAPVYAGHSGETPEDYDYVPVFPCAADGRQRFIGLPSQLQEDMAAYAEAGVEQIVLRFAFPWDPEIGVDRHIGQMRAFAEQVLPSCADL